MVAFLLWERGGLGRGQKMLVLVFLILFLATGESLNFFPLSFLRYKMQIMIDHNGMKIEINYRRKTGKLMNT